MVMVVVSSALQATLEDCVCLQLRGGSEDCMAPAEHSLSQLTELHNKLMLIATKAEEGREEANRFLEVGAAPTSP